MIAFRSCALGTAWVSRDLGAPRPHADHPASVSPRQSLGDLGGDCERPAAARRALHPFLSSRRRPCFVHLRETPSGSEEGNGGGARAKRGAVKPVPRMLLPSLACIVLRAPR